MGGMIEGRGEMLTQVVIQAAISRDLELNPVRNLRVSDSSHGNNSIKV